MTTGAYKVAGHCYFNKVRVDDMPKIGTYADVEAYVYRYDDENSNGMNQVRDVDRV